MIRARLAILAAAAGLSLASGCSNCGHSWCGGPRCCPVPYDATCSPCAPACGPCQTGYMNGGAVVGAGGPMLVVPPQSTIGPVNPPAGMPQLSAPPRLTPQPISQPTPYVPQ